MEVEKFLELNRLFDIYKDILTEKQKNILSLYIEHDLSLGEISKEIEISRQGVYDSIKKSEQLLFDLEDKIGYLSREEFLQDKVRDIQKILDENKIDASVKKRINQICEEII